MSHSRLSFSIGFVVFCLCGLANAAALSTGHNSMASSGRQSGSDRSQGVPEFHPLNTTTPARALKMSGGFSSGSSSQLGGRSQAQQQRRQDPTPTTPHDTRPTPDPTGAPSDSTTVHITSTSDFSLLLPSRQDEHVSDAESDGLSSCSPSSSEPHCQNKMQDGFIVAAAMQTADDGSYIQITGCLNPANSLLDASDHGGQLDVRFPNGAQCTFGGYGASFIELVEPALNRFCIRCCASANDQTNCNSHQDRLGCETAIPGTYDFPDVGVSCS